MAKVIPCILAVVWICSASSAWKFKLNVPRVLLPLADEGSNFLLHSEGGCFQWSSTRPEVVKVVPTKLNEECGNHGDKFAPILATHLEGSIQDKPVSGCTSSAIIRLPPRWGGAPSIAKTQAIVTAEDAHSDGHVLRCDVIVDRIHRLQIVTKTLELFLEEAPEEFSVRAYDDQGNEFSSLEGIVFTWSVESASNQEENVKFIKFRDSTYALEPTLMALEAKGLQGSKVLLEGVRTGSSKVSVRLASKTYSDVPPAEVTVMVVANLFLVPHSTYVLSGATVDYHAEQMKSNKIHKIDLAASQQYYLEVPSDFARNHPYQKGTIIAKSVIGATEVILRDNNVGKDDAVKSPSADLHIVAPAYITIDIDPHSNWNVILGQSYSLHISVFDSQNHRLFSSSNLVAELEVEAGYFDVLGKTENGTWIHGRPIKTGTAEVRAVLLGTKDVETGNLVELAMHLKAKAQLEIFDPIILEPALSLLPWDPATKSIHQIAYTITSNQSSSFIWTSLNASVATVTQNGIAKTTSQLGETTITAAMNRANHNRGDAVIIVTPVVGLEILVDQVLEVETGSNLLIPLSFWGEGSKKFTRCAEINFVSVVADKAIMLAQKELPGDHELPAESCALVGVQGLSPGFSKLTVSFSYVDEKPVKISDHVTIGVYDPLLPVQPSAGVTVLSVGSSVDIAWSGGPQPWIFSPEAHFHTLTTKEDSIVDINEKVSIANGFYVYRVTCSKLGEAIVSLTVGNKKSKALLRPVSATSEVTVVCAEPNRLHLEASPERPLGPCPLMAKTGRVAALCYENLRINVTVLDSLGRKFDNFSTLEITWSHSDDSLGELQVQHGVVKAEAAALNESEAIYQDFALARGFQVLLTKQKPGPLEITGTLKKSSYLMDRSISDVLQILLVEDAEIVPKKLALFNHPESSAKLNIQHGSGYFEVISSEAGVAQHKFTASNKSVHLTSGAEGSTTIWAKDLCLSSKSMEAFSRANAIVNVIGIHKVELQMVDKVQKGSEITAIVKLWDQFGDLISSEASNDNFLSISVSAASKDTATIESQGYHNREFVIKGAALGHTTLTAVAVYGTKRVSSSVMPLQVFPPLELEPRNITLIIGSQFQIQVRGGPGQPDASIEFSTSNGKIASTDTAGIISALTLGSLKLNAKAIGTDRLTGQKIVFSSDSVDVHVVKLHGVRIKAPILRMKAGTEMPLTVVGLDHVNQNGFSYGSALPNLLVSWSLSDQDVGRLESPFWKNGVSVNNRNNGAMRFLARKPGRTVIKLGAKITAPIDTVGQFQLDKDMEFSDHLEIVVFEELRGRSPSVGDNNLLLAPNSEFQLRTNRDGVSGVVTSYSVLPVVPGQDGSNIISVSRTGKVSSKRVLGTAIILVKTTEDQAVIQEMSITVHVKPISYVMLNAMAIIEPKSSLTTWPLGVKLPLEVTFHDESGVKFNAVDENGMQANTETRPNRFDSNLITSEKKTANHSLFIELTRPGFTVLRTACGTAMDDFLFFDVDSAILPSPGQIGVGDVLVLDNLAQGVRSPNGKWSSEPSGLLHIESGSGLAVALKSGTARIFYSLGDETQSGLSTNIEIVKAKKITFLPIDSDRHLTNQLRKVQAIPVSVVSDSGKLTNLVSNGAVNVSTSANGAHFTKSLFSCTATFDKERRAHDLSSIFHVTAGFYRGNYACLFTAYDDSTIFHDTVVITITPGPSLGSSVAEEKGAVPFSSVFRIVTEASVLLTNVEPQKEIVITGLDHVLASIVVTASDPHYLSVGSGYNQGEDSRGWTIGVKSAYWSEARPGTDLSVTVSSALTDQSVVIPIKVSFRGDQCANIELGWSSLVYFLAGHYQSVLVIIASCVICVLITRLVAAQAATSKPSETKPAGPDLAKTPLRMGNGVPQLQSPTLLNSENKPYLWTVNDSPVYGSPSPLSRRSPRSLSQYSYTDH